MNSATEIRAVLGGEKNMLRMAGKWPQMLWLGTTLALTLASASAQSYRVLRSFGGSDGQTPRAGLLLASNVLYGTTDSGGTSNLGVVFKVNTDGSGYSVLKNFTGSDGWMPYAGLIASGRTLYGTTVRGGTWDDGVIFKVNTDGSGYTVLKSFRGTDGGYPWAGLLLAGGTLYGTAQSTISRGVVFKVNTDGSGYTVLKNFTGADGGTPYCTLVLGDGILYGTTYDGGISNYGVVFKIGTDGTGYGVLKSFTNSNEAGPQAGLVLGGGTLYGTALLNGGVVFKINTDGSGYTVLKTFTSEVSPWAGLILAGRTLYGTTYAGGIWGCGVVFDINTDGSGYTVLNNFSSADGAYSQAGLVMGDGFLYGTTTSGGTWNHGAVFSLATVCITQQPETQTAETGTTVMFRVVTSPASGLAYQWFFGGTNPLPGATNAVLALTNIQPVQAGAYTVAVSDLYGAMTSAPAFLSVIPFVERRIVPAIILPAGSNLLHLEYADTVAMPLWSSVSNVILGAGPQFCFDLSQPLPAQRFYRAWQTNGPQPSLGASMATAILLTGAVGNSVRIDYINAIGPIDAWVTLATVTLTNTTQLYFDTTAFGQPTRLYRLAPMP